MQDKAEDFFNKDTVEVCFTKVTEGGNVIDLGCRLHVTLLLFFQWRSCWISI